MAQYCKYYKLKKQVSYDNGVTFVDVTPAEYSKGELIEEHSVDCGYVGPTQQALTFVPLESGYFTIATTDTNVTNTVYYSTDGGSTWNTVISTSASTTPSSIQATAGNKIMWKSNSVVNLTFNSSCNYNVEGNILSLDYGDSFTGQTSVPNTRFGGRYYGLFKGSTKLISAEDLIMPQSYSSYSGNMGTCGAMFQNCTSLIKAPALPATSLINDDYAWMFAGCISLITAPALPATTLCNWCYHQMFNGCTSLTTAPALPATTLTEHCYQGMFDGCTSLSTAPVLSATTLAESCYNGMFGGCISLTTAPALPATNLAELCYNSMFYGCSGLTTAPVLSATTLANRCYRWMFYNCTSLTTAPELPATTLTDECYLLMFNGCTSLNYIKCLATNISATDCTKYWVLNTSSNGTFVKASSMSSWSSGVNGIASNWTVQNA